MFAIKVCDSDNNYTMYDADAYSSSVLNGNRTIHFWQKGSGSEPGVIVVDGDKTNIVFVMNGAGETVDVVRPVALV